MSSRTPQAQRTPLNRDRVVAAAIRLADESGIEILSMRYLAQELEVVPMAIYKHVANKEELLNEMIDSIIREIDPLVSGVEWKSALRHRILSARFSLLRHPWAAHVIESRAQASPIVLSYMDSLIGIFLDAGFSIDLTHHAMHALGSRMWGFIQEVFPTPTPPKDPKELAAFFAEWLKRYPAIIRMASAQTHDSGSSVVAGCDDQFEFEFALDLLLDGFERMHNENWSSTTSGRGKSAPLESQVRGKRI